MLHEHSLSRMEGIFTVTKFRPSSAIFILLIDFKIENWGSESLCTEVVSQNRTAFEEKKKKLIKQNTHTHTGFKPGDEK